MKMDKNELLGQIHSAKGLSDCYEFCKVAYQFLLKQQPEERPEMLAWFFHNASEVIRCEEINISLPEDPCHELNRYAHEYRKLIRSFISFFSDKGYPKNLYYQKLWDSLEPFLLDATPEKKGFCLLDILGDARTPYYELPAGLRLSVDRFKETFECIKTSIQQLDFAIELSRSQRQKTELASHIVHLLETLNSSEDKSVFLVCFLNRYEKLWDERKTNEDSNKTVDSAEPNPREQSSAEKSKDTTFLPGNTPNDDDVHIIARYQYPSINDNEYAFVLVKKGDGIFLSDQGKTLKELDRIFELREPDVIKNLVAIMKQCGAEKQGDEFVIEIDNWNGNINEDENEDLKKGILSLFSCVSFMLNMKIFYV